jgi:Holliday junction resolvase RusA-like endonuclease
MILEFEIDIEPISVNKLYGNIPGQARRFVSTEGKKFKSSVGTIIRDTVLREHLSPVISALAGKPLQVFVQVGLNSWFLKDGKTIRKKDIDNTAKALLDTIFSTLSEFCEDIDDSQIWSLVQDKVVSETPRVIVIIQECDIQL